MSPGKTTYLSQQILTFAKKYSSYRGTGIKFVILLPSTVNGFYRRHEKVLEFGVELLTAVSQLKWAKFRCVVPANVNSSQQQIFL